MDNLKNNWKEWDNLVGKEIGLGWVIEKKTIQVSAEWWDRKMKVFIIRKRVKITPDLLEMDQKYPPFDFWVKNPHH